MTNLTQLHQNDLGHGGTSCHMLGSSDDTTELTRVIVQRQRKEYFQATQLSCRLVKTKIPPFGLFSTPSFTWMVHILSELKLFCFNGALIKSKTLTMSSFLCYMPETVVSLFNALSHLILMTILLVSQFSRWGLERLSDLHKMLVEPKFQARQMALTLESNS